MNSALPNCGFHVAVSYPYTFAYAPNTDSALSEPERDTDLLLASPCADWPWVRCPGLGSRQWPRWLENVLESGGLALPKVLRGTHSLEGAEDRAANTTHLRYLGIQNTWCIHVYCPTQDLMRYFSSAGQRSDCVFLVFLYN